MTTEVAAAAPVYVNNGETQLFYSVFDGAAPEKKFNSERFNYVAPESDYFPTDSAKYYRQLEVFDIWSLL